MAYIRIAVRPALIAFAILAVLSAALLLISSSAAGEDDVARPPAGRLGQELTEERSTGFALSASFDYAVQL